MPKITDYPSLYGNDLTGGEHLILETDDGTRNTTLREIINRVNQSPINPDDYYTKDVADGMFVKTVNGTAPDIYGNVKVTTSGGGTADLTNYYTKTQTDGLVNSKYSKPSGGIPKADLASAVQTSLANADSAVKTVNGKFPDSKGNVIISTEGGSTTSGGYRGGTAVILGDSLFDNSRLLFGQWLMEQNIYDVVWDHSYEGSGFGNTFMYRNGHSLYDILTKTGSISDNKERPHRDKTTTYETIRQHIADADAIYISCGGNDIQAHYIYTEPGMNPDHVHDERPNTMSFTALVTGALQKIFELTYDKTTKTGKCAPIYFQMPFDCKWIVKNYKTYLPNTTMYHVAETAKAWYEIERAIAKVDANVVINTRFINDYGYTMDARSVHPERDSAILAYKNVVYGNYRPKFLDELVIRVLDGNPVKDDLRDAVSLVANGQLDEECKLLLYSQTGSGTGATVHLTSIPRMVINDCIYSYQFMDMHSSASSGKVRMNTFMIKDSDVVIQMYDVTATKYFDGSGLA